MSVRFRITYLSVTSTDPGRLLKTCQRVNDELGTDIELAGFTKDRCEEDPTAFEDLCKHTLNCDLVLIRCMGDPWKFKRFDRYRQYLERTSAFVAPVSGSLDVDMMTRGLFSGTDEELGEMVRRSLYKCPENDFRFIWWIANHFGLTDRSAPEPEIRPRHGLHHPRYPSDGTVEEYLNGLDRSKITVGILFSGGERSYGNDGYLFAVVNRCEEMGMNTVPVSASFDTLREEGGTAEVLRTYFMKDGAPAIDVMISLTGYANINRADGRIPVYDEESCFRKLIDVPIVYGMFIHGPFRDFELDRQGMKKSDFGSNVIYPELDGNVLSVPVTYRKPEEPDRSTPIPERIDHVCRLARNWGSLRRKPASERRVAVMMWQSHSSSGYIGSASGLDTIESISDLLQRMSSLGYRVDDVPVDGRALIESILDGVTNDLESMSVQSVRDRAADLMTKQTYEAPYGRIPGWDREMTFHDWGDPVGEVMTDDGKIIIPGLVKGNVFVCYQPTRGWTEKMEQNIHDPLLFTQHQYNGLYWWIRDVFKADMIMHMGTHGTLEWLPGLNVGLSDKCNPDYVLDAVPNVYPYIINDPGEGVQAKRRSESLLIGHMSPTMARADSYDELEEVSVQLQQYFSYRAQASEETRRQMVSQVYSAAKKNNLFHDLGIPDGSDPGPDGFEEYIVPLHEYLSEAEDTLVRADLHILGRIPRGEHFDEMVYSLTRLNNGEIPSLRDAFAANAGIDLQKAIEDPSGFTGTELNSVLAERIDSELREFLRSFREDMDYSLDSATAYIGERYGAVSEALASSLRFAVERVVPSILKMPYEIDHMMDATDGRFVIPGPSGAPTRGNADILPTGRNFYSLDPDCVPTKASWKIGCRMADQFIERFVEDHGTFPREIGMVIWATDMMKTGGDDAAYVLWLLGVRPVWSSVGGQVVDLEVIPLSELGRPRVDVSVNITGLFRDTFPVTIDLLDDAVKMVAELDESDEDNALAANLRADIIEGIANGMSPDEARKRNSVRIFGEALGTYGNGVGRIIDSKVWEETSDIADIYADLSSYGYMKGEFGTPMKNEFVKRFSRIEATVKNAPTREIDILDIDDVWQYLGGMNAFVRAYGRKDATSYMGDNSDPERTKIKSTQEELRFLYRVKVRNPKFTKGLMEHGYRGASEMAKIARYTMAWDATSGITEDWMYETLAEKYLFDQEVHDWMDDVNPHATMDILNTLQEAMERGMWEPSQECLDKLKDLYLQTEERLEEFTDR